MRKRFGLAVVMAVAALLADPSFGQQPDSGDAAKAPVTRKKPAGRLPSYFSAVVSQQQRLEIYKIQASYAEQLEKLQAQMELLVANRDRDVEAVLDAEQLAAVNKKRDEAKKRRAARSSSKSNAPAPTDS